MKTSLYIIHPVRICRKHNTLALEPATKKEAFDSPVNDLADAFPMDEEEVWWRGTPKQLPIERISTIYVLAPADFNSKLLVFLNQKKIPLHLFNYYGYYSGTFWPRNPYPNGKITKAQIIGWDGTHRQIKLCKTLLGGAFHNMLRNVRYHQRRTSGLEDIIDQLQELDEQRTKARQKEVLLGIEGRFHKVYYQFLNKMAKPEFTMGERVYRPPNNPANALLSFLNVMTYTAVLSELFRTQLDPTIGLLHAPGRHRYPLAYDLAELFKPLLAHRLLLSLPNKRQLIAGHFEKSLKGCYLKPGGRKVATRAFEASLRTTVKHRKLNRSVSYRYLMRLEAWKLIRNLIENKPYEAFKLWW